MPCCGIGDFTGTGFQGFGDDSGCCDSVAGQGGGRVVALVISHSTRDRTSDDPFNHYSMLRTLEDLFGLAHLGASATAVDMITG